MNTQTITRESLRAVSVNVNSVEENGADVRITPQLVRIGEEEEQVEVAPPMPKEVPAEPEPIKEPVEVPTEPEKVPA